jgi:phosphatidylglycerophosphate synthase
MAVIESDTPTNDPGQPMLDGAMRTIIDPPLNRAGTWLAARGASANVVTVVGLVLGVIAAGLVAFGQPIAAMFVMLASRLADGLDGAVARANGKTDFGGYLDISCDFLFYGLFAASFVALDPAANGVVGVILLASFYFNGATFLGFAILAERKKLVTQARGHKSLYFTGGLLEGTETIAFFAVLCLFPALYPVLGGIFAALCFVTGFSRILLAARIF